MKPQPSNMMGARKDYLREQDNHFVRLFLKVRAISEFKTSFSPFSSIIEMFLIKKTKYFGRPV